MATKRDDENQTQFALRAIRDEILESAIKAADCGCPRNEPGEYWRGRFAAADAIEVMLSEPRKK